MKGGGVNLRDIDSKKHEIEQLSSERNNIIASLRYLPDEASRQDAGREIEHVNDKIASANLELQELQNKKVSDEVDLNFDLNSEAGKFKVNAILCSVLDKVVLDDLDCRIFFKNGNNIKISYVLMKGLAESEDRMKNGEPWE
ncbi:hypothetical protein FA893_18155 [Photobacterium damselae subsp. piscicida]|nr:hypothetical protein [Photobacterium damselae]OLQ78711.1 hypothetical protein BEI67_19100 [Photobacterium damselae subsp. piscicida]PSV77714.1 hypothetical protein CTT35_05650 [Photobacterium damselae]PSW79914.1 hypothetical protein CTT37_06125 [Photobacterium damselae]TFZ63962.1 hypothetical protein E4T25_01480 [Photobacterium damselae subsp. piscicida]TJZ82325.1 hypothetical protein FA893_18155 [Photobacterium damselae subsp. piscicida]